MSKLSIHRDRRGRLRALVDGSVLAGVTKIEIAAAGVQPAAIVLTLTAKLVELRSDVDDD